MSFKSVMAGLVPAIHVLNDSPPRFASNVARRPLLCHRGASGGRDRRSLISALASRFYRRFIMRRSIILVGVAVLTFLSGVHAQQLQRVQIGVLECRGGASVGFI